MTTSSKIDKRAIALIAAGGLLAVAVVFAVLSTQSGTESGVASGDTSQTATAAAWRDIELTDVETGDTFTVADLEGSVVAIEPMAVWCTQCKVQNDNFKQAYADLEAAGVHVISLGVEPNERPGALAEYADRRGYDWTFALSPIELSRALADQFTAQVLAVPATPLIVLSPEGEVVFQDFGFHGPESLIEITTAAAETEALS